MFFFFFLLLSKLYLLKFKLNLIYLIYINIKTNYYIFFYWASNIKNLLIIYKGKYKIGEREYSKMIC